MGRPTSCPTLKRSPQGWRKMIWGTMYTPVVRKLGYPRSESLHRWRIAAAAAVNPSLLASKTFTSWAPVTNPDLRERKQGDRQFRSSNRSWKHDSMHQLADGERTSCVRQPRSQGSYSSLEKIRNSFHATSSVGYSFNISYHVSDSPAKSFLQHSNGLLVGACRSREPRQGKA